MQIQLTMKRHYSDKFDFSAHSNSYRTMPVAMITSSGSSDGESIDVSLGEYSIDPVEIWGSGGNDNQGDLEDQMSYLDSIFGGSGDNNGIINTCPECSSLTDSEGSYQINSHEYGNLICEMTSTHFTQVKPLLDKLPAFLKLLKVRVKVGRTKGNAPAQYIQSTNTVVLNEQYVNAGDYDDIDSMLEEFFHAMQNISFKDRGIDMSKQPKSAVEYEAKVMKWLYEAAMLEEVKMYKNLSDLLDWLYKCLVDLTNANGYDWNIFDYNTFYDNYQKYYDLFVGYYKSLGDDDIGNYSEGDYMFWKDHWDHYFEQMKIIFNGENDFWSTITIDGGSGVGSSSYPDAGSY